MRGLPPEELRVGEGRQALDARRRPRGKPSEGNVQHVGLRHGEAIGEVAGRKRACDPMPPRRRGIVAGLGRRRPRHCGNRLHLLLSQALDLGEEEPLVDVGLEVLIHKHAVAAPLGAALEGRGVQVSKPSFGNGRLSWEHAVVGVEGDRPCRRHGLGDERAAEVARELGGNRALEEEPHVPAVARAGPLDTGLNAMRPPRRTDGCDRALPIPLVEIHHEQRGVGIRVQNVESEHIAQALVLTLEMADNRLVGELVEGLAGTARALGLWVRRARADAATPLVRAGGGEPDATVLLAKAMRVDVGTPGEQRAEQGDLLAGGALRGNDAPLAGVLPEIGGHLKPAGLGEVALLSRAAAHHDRSAVFGQCGIDPLHEAAHRARHERVLGKGLVHGTPSQPVDSEKTLAVSIARGGETIRGRIAVPRLPTRPRASGNPGGAHTGNGRPIAPWLPTAIPTVRRHQAAQALPGRLRP